MEPVACPRCAYDLSGQLEGYRESCPITGVCSECGCAFEWRNIMGDAACPRWFVEHPERSASRTVLPTLVRLIYPGGFWRRVMMEHPPRWWRAVLSLVTIYLGLGVVTGGVLGIEAWRAHTLSGATWIVRADGTVIPATPQPWWDLYGETTVRRVAGGVLFPLTIRSYDEHYYSEAARRWRGTTAPWHTHIGTTPSVFAVVPLSTMLATTFMFFVPMQTRKTYRVQGWHVLRIAIYGLAGAVALGFGLNVIAVLVAEHVSGWRYSFMHHCVPWLPILASATWTLAWWSSATRHYLRIGAWQGFSWPLVGVGVLAGFTVQYVYALLVFPMREGLSYVPGGNLF